MNIGQKKLSPDEVKEIVRLRFEEDLSFNIIADMIHRDRSTIIYHCSKAGLINHKWASNIKIRKNKGGIAGFLKQKKTKKKKYEYGVPRQKYSEYEKLLIDLISKQKFLTERERNREISNRIQNYRFAKHYYV